MDAVVGCGQNIEDVLSSWGGEGGVLGAMAARCVRERECVCT